MLMQLPNESDFIEVEIDLKDFKIDKDINGISFGWYHGTYVAIKDNK